MSKRRNPFETPEPVPSVTIPSSIYESLRVAAPRKRNRRWEKQHQSHKAVYRGVDPKLALKVRTIAGNLLVPEGEVARAVIEYALHAYEQGNLDLHPRPNPYRMRMTLFPASDSTRSYDRPVKPAKQKQTQALWRVITTWRGFPHELKKELATLASDDELNVPIGELITALLRYGLKAYDSGLLNLEPVPKSWDIHIGFGWHEMNFTQNINVNPRNEFNVGGTDNVPPTGCLPPARASAHVPAYVERTGKAVTNKSDDMWTVSPVTGNGLVSFSELRL